MQWARGKSADGTVITGVVEDGMLHPRAALGSADAAGEAVALETLEMLAPVQPGKFIGLWNNFHAAREKQGLEVPEHVLFFLKPASSVAGPSATVKIPEGVGRVVYEGELGIVIGKNCANATVDEAEDAILGYTCINDFTAIQVLTADDSFPQWTRAKGYDGFGVIGPVIETDLDWSSVSIRVEVNGRERQNYPASDMIKPPAQIVSELSQDMTLHPGDVIACGTSVGALPVKAGQEVEVLIDGIGGVKVTMG
ncbi:FAA hydrolase family protein [Thalassococcus profundi]|uniref:FAA hydrolase family protein n=1 Tax=Thalassococcus profundi TaxID=2282382 RepID=A0A369TPP4_9RHOB|nr:fumarylacetoacetate hydrolase family protein [Thalassococcus profundi]RDD67140.1 FAA hydrolase family protein [Thalassococcus profundi]